MSKPRVLFVTYGGGHVNMCLPVIKRLQQQDVDIKVLGLTTAAPVLRRNGIDCFGFLDLCEDAPAGAMEYGRRLTEGMAAGAVSIEESRAYMGINYAELVDRLGEAEAEHRFAEKGRQAFFPADTMRRLLQKIQPDLVVTTSSPRCERATIVAATQLGIPSLVMVDLFATEEYKWLSKNDFGSRICVGNHIARDRIINAGRNPGQVVLTGNPAFDGLALTDVDTLRRAEREKLKLSDDEVLIAWMSQPEPSVHPHSGATGDPSLPRLVDQALLEIVGRHPGMRLAIRHHPSELVSQGQLLPGVIYSPGSEPVLNLLAAADCVVTMSSTVGLEGAILGKPLVQLLFSVTAFGAPYVELGIAEGAASLGDMEPAILAALAGAGRAYQLPSAGMGTQSVVDEIMALLKQHAGN